ncbi:hypothetical protein [Pelagerythrobacter marinus]|uniref:hypothetical protein n=1 Tax=Pelagerythrobacter marinus TaxID=538382 RepID=UPI002AC953DB|nr:hypothetical protein [Pelagerythrobacter marinus]WPZ05641.1 hypothetical protein T8T98_09385 [Pelagerythrobacter marinus]
MRQAVPVIHVHARAEREAWDAYRAMLEQQRANPALFDNRAWGRLRDEAYARWHKHFVVA